MNKYRFFFIDANGDELFSAVEYADNAADGLRKLMAYSERNPLEKQMSKLEICDVTKTERASRWMDE